MLPNSHLETSTRLCGAPVALRPGYAHVRMHTCREMVVDAHGLVHGGFVFGQADYAAMLAVNDPNVVLGAAQTRFLAPVPCGAVLDAEATVRGSVGRKRHVSVTVHHNDRAVFEGEFTCFVLNHHILTPPP